MSDCQIPYYPITNINNAMKTFRSLFVRIPNNPPPHISSTVQYSIIFSIFSDNYFLTSNNFSTDCKQNV